MRKRSLSSMTPPELIQELQKMDAAIERLKDTKDATGLFQLASARALKFAIECQMRSRNLSPAPTPTDVNVISLSEYRLRRASKCQTAPSFPTLPQAS